VAVCEPKEILLNPEELLAVFATASITTGGLFG
jgi:hypothetical protein